MDAKEHVQRALLQVFRASQAQTLFLDVGPLATPLRGDTTRGKDALQPALDDLVAEGVLVRQGSRILLA